MPRSLSTWTPDEGSSERMGREGPEILRFGKEILLAEAEALRIVSDRLDEQFEHTVELILGTIELGTGRILTCGVGKCADIARKITGTLNSTGTRSTFLDPVQAVHGDLGLVHPHDVVMLFSHSGESEEITKLLEPLSELCSALIGVTGNRESSLAKRADIALVYGPLEEVCPLGLAPSASSTTMLALGDAVAFSVSRARGFGQEDFARFHPAGSLGRKLARVEQVMRHTHEARIAPDTKTIREVMAQGTGRGRRTGAVILVDDTGALSGIFTDSDFARLIARKGEEWLDMPISEAMTRNPLVARFGSRVGEAMQQMSDRKISELPVVDAKNRPLGILDITDLIGIAGAAARKKAA